MATPLSLQFTKRVAAPPGQVWSVLGDFGNEHRWARLIRDSGRDRPRVEVGAVRRCELEKPVMGRDHVEEELVRLEPGVALAYRLRGGLGPFSTIENEWRIRGDGDGTLVTARAALSPRNAALGLIVAPLVRAYLRFTLRDVMDQFAAYVESGEGQA